MQDQIPGKRVGELIAKYIQNDLTAEEQLELDRWVAASEENRKTFAAVTDPEEIRNKIKFLDSLEKTWRYQSAEESAVHAVFLPEAKRSGFRLVHLVAAACTLIALTITIYLYQRIDKRSVLTSENIALADIPGATNHALLKLSDGRTIALDSQAIAGDDLETQASIHVNGAGEISYQANASQVSSLVYNSIVVPRGGIYNLVLDDGTKVWLNNETVIRYPVAFLPDIAERRVYLQGEAYFEVAKDKSKPFIIEFPDSKEIRVLGTKFNARAFAGEKSITTTLVEGSVQLSSRLKNKQSESVVMHPGEQSTIYLNKERESIVTEKQADLDAALAWKNGLFHFNDNTSFEEVMTQVARWYDIEVVYKRPLEHLSFSGDLYRSMSLNSLLTNLEKVIDVKFQKKEKVVTVL